MAQFIFANFPLGIPCGQDVRTHYIRCIVNVNSLIVFIHTGQYLGFLHLHFDCRSAGAIIKQSLLDKVSNFSGG